MATPDKLTFATQGNEYSYHAEAARIAAGVESVNDIDVISHEEFGDINKDARQYHPGLGVVAYTTVVGAVDKGIRSIMGKRTSAMAPIVARVDVPVSLKVISHVPQDISDIRRLHGFTLLGQEPALEQSRDTLTKRFPLMKREIRNESTKAIQEVVDRKDPNLLALGPAHAAEPMGGVIISEQINPFGSITSFYVLQRDPRPQILPIDSEKTEMRTVLALLHPEGQDEMAQIVGVAEALGIVGTRFVAFNPKTPTRHNPDRKKDGGILEVSNEYYAPELTEFCARVNALNGNDGVGGPFDAKRLGEFAWKPEEPINLHEALLPAAV